jgi:hypothetical protein
MTTQGEQARKFNLAASQIDNMAGAVGDRREAAGAETVAVGRRGLELITENVRK